AGTVQLPPCWAPPGKMQEPSCKHRHAFHGQSTSQGYNAAATEEREMKESDYGCEGQTHPQSPTEDASPYCCIGLVNPKSPENVGAVMRAAGCYGADEVYYTGNRFELARRFATD